MLHDATTFSLRGVPQRGIGGDRCLLVDHPLDERDDATLRAGLTTTSPDQHSRCARLGGKGRSGASPLSGPVSGDGGEIGLSVVFDANAEVEAITRS